MAAEQKPSEIKVALTVETLERITFLATKENVSVVEMAGRLLSEAAEAEAGLARGPFLRKYMYR